MLNVPHIFYKTGDLDTPNFIKDRNGEVVLNLCRMCWKAEGDLSSSCPRHTTYNDIRKSLDIGNKNDKAN